MANKTLISLNIWGGYLKNNLLSFFHEQQQVDIFCLQEVYESAQEKISTCDMELSLDIFNDIAQCLPNHRGYFCPVVPHYGLAIFITKKLSIIAEDNILIHENNEYAGRGPTHQRLMQCLTYQCDDQQLTVCNVHGLWNGKGKSDSPKRIIQSKNISEHLNSIKNPYILCGDFNLEPNTESLQLIKDGLTDHINDNNITSTRTSHYKKPVKYADYVFTDPCILTLSFKVLSHEVSDHAPLLLTFTSAKFFSAC